MPPPETIESPASNASSFNKNNIEEDELHCDYLVVGTGTVGMSFVDTMLTEHPTATIIMVDRNDQPGGHWNNAYPFVKLHQQSCNYGVNSVILGKNLNSKGFERYDVYDRATGAEIVAYFARVRDKFLASGRVRFFFSSEYEFDPATGDHTIFTNAFPDNAVKYHEEKKDAAGLGDEEGDFVNGVAKDDSLFRQTTKVVLKVVCKKIVTIPSDIIVPSMRKPLIPVDETVHFVPINCLPDSLVRGSYTQYVVFGAGKTGTDAITYLLEQKVDPSQITWIISRDIWYMLRDGYARFWDFFDALDAVSRADSAKDAWLAMEEIGLMGRLDPNQPFPEVFKGASIDRSELESLRKIKNVVRMGRATAIRAHTVEFGDRGSLEFDPQTTLLVDCMVDDFYGYQTLVPEDACIFKPKEIRLYPGVAVSNFGFAAAHAAFLECALGDDDDAKNNACYFVRGSKYSKWRYDEFIGHLYMQNKSIEALQGVKGGAKFFFSSRTVPHAPQHHKGGLPKLLWYMYGPRQAYKINKRIDQKIETYGYSDIDHKFGVETLGTVEIDF